MKWKDTTLLDVPRDASPELLAEIAKRFNAYPNLVIALRELYLETADYILINHLGDVHHNQSMKLSRDALQSIGELARKDKPGNCPNKSK